MIIVITGPTAVGKTKMSIELAKRLNGEIINADSMQIYQGLDIGTAKVTSAEKDNIPHYLLDIKNPQELYTVYDYQKDARQIIKDIQNRQKTPILVGGTGLYIKAALYDYQFSTEEKQFDYTTLNNQELLDKIEKYKIDINFDIQNRRRLIRVLTKLENNTYNNNENAHILYPDVYFIGLTTNRELLYSKINERVDEMFTAGLMSEVKKSYDQGINSKALKTGIGYKELYDYFSGKITLEECKELIKQRSRKYAKRQYTFFNHQLPIKWFNVNYNNFNETINEILKYIEKTNNIELVSF